MQLLSLSSDIVDRKYVSSHLRAENDLSEVHVVIGTVQYNRKRLCISQNNDLYTGLEFIASHMVRTDVTYFTVGRACLTNSTHKGSCFCKLSKFMSSL